MIYFKHLPLRRKIFLLLLLVALIPFSITNLYWYTNARDTVYKNAEQSLSTINEQSVEIVNNFLNTKLLGFFSHAQGAALLSGNPQLIQNDLQNFLLQDPDIISLSLADISGQEIVKIDREKVYSPELRRNVKNDPEFKVPAFKFGKEYISEVDFKGNEAIIKVSTPVVYPENSQSLLTFSSSKESPRKPGEVYGVLIGEISLKRLQTTIESIHIGSTGHVSIYGSTGKAVIHKDKNIIGINIQNKLSSSTRESLQPLAITKVVTPIPRLDTNIQNIPVLTSHMTFPRTRWLIVVEQPISEISADIERIQMQAIPLFTIPFLIVIALSFIFSDSLTRPINILVRAATQIGKGQFDYPFSIRTSDELEKLSDSYHEMANQLKADRNELLVERNTLSNVLNTTANGYIGLDQNCTILFLNNAAKYILHKETDEIQNKHFDTVFTLKQDDSYIKMETLCYKSPTEKDILELIVSDTTTKTIKLSIAQVPNHIISPLKYIVTLTDISKEQELEDMKIDFVSLAAHELRTPITSIHGYLSLYEELVHTSLTDQQRESLERVKESADRLRFLVDDILEVTRIDRPNIALDYKPTNWDALLQKCIDEQKAKADQKHLEISYTKPEQNTSDIMVDQVRIMEVLANLIDNAIKYTDSGKVSIWFTTSDTEITTYVKDSGKGIPDSSIPKLFSKFYRVPSKLVMTTQGTGLGLYISKKIIGLHNGKIWVESVENQGSTFAFSLPLKHS